MMPTPYWKQPARRICPSTMPATPTCYLVDQDGAWSSAAANNYMQTILSQYSEANGNMIELVIANNDEMAIGAVAALQNGGYNLEDGSSKVIPVFGVDATDAAKDAIGKGTMTGTIKQDADGMANTIAQITQNYLAGARHLQRCRCCERSRYLACKHSLCYLHWRGII